MPRLRRPALALALAFAAGCGEASPEPFVVITFNSGTTEGVVAGGGGNGYGPAQAALSDAHYGDGLAWQRAVDDTRAFLATARPAIIGFQEIFYSGDCAMVPAEARAGFVCETWTEGDATVAQTVLGADYQVACHPGKNDKCLAVRRDFGALRGCEGALCLDGLDGEGVEGCGRGARVAFADVDRPGQDSLRIAHVHGSSGFSEDDVGCRVAQFEQAFAGLATKNVVLGDFNTDPVRLFDGDDSAGTLRRGSTKYDLQFITAVGEDAPPTYGGLLNIDHVLSDFADGGCTSETVTELVYFDHRPQVCTLTPR